MRIAVIGAGRVGTALATRWRDSGHEIVAVSGRDATADRAATYLPGVRVVGHLEAAAAGEVVVLAVPDAALGAMAASVRPALEPGAWLLHVSGASGIAVLGDGRRIALHPLQTFPDPDGARLTGCAAAVTASDDAGLALGMSLARDVGARPFELREEDRARYHAAAVFASNHVVATSWFAERLFAAAGVSDPLPAMAPLQRATVDNVADAGPAAALTGPAVRGDADTVAANLAAIAPVAPDAVPVYVAMCRAIVEIAVEAGRLDADGRAAVERALAPWS